jgi:hypothetical protein
MCLQNAHNVLVSSSSVARHGLVAKVADLGLSKILQQQATHRTTRTVRFLLESATVLSTLHYSMEATIRLFLFPKPRCAMFTTARAAQQCVQQAVLHGVFFGCRLAC